MALWVLVQRKGLALFQSVSKAIGKQQHLYQVASETRLELIAPSRVAVPERARRRLIPFSSLSWISRYCLLCHKKLLKLCTM